MRQRQGRAAHGRRGRRMTTAAQDRPRPQGPRVYCPRSAPAARSRMRGVGTCGAGIDVRGLVWRCRNRIGDSLRATHVPTDRYAIQEAWCVEGGGEGWGAGGGAGALWGEEGARRTTAATVRTTSSQQSSRSCAHARPVRHTGPALGVGHSRQQPRGSCSRTAQSNLATRGGIRLPQPNQNGASDC